MRSLSAGVVAVVVVVVVVLAALGIYYYYSRAGGQVYIYLTDPGHGSSPGPSNSSAATIYVTVTSIMIHSEQGSWITVSNSTRTVQLTSALSLLATKSLPPGNYTEVRLVVSAVTVEVGTTNFTATLPSGVLKIPIVQGGLQVSRGRTAYLVIYMGPHLTQTGTGQYILRPVVTAVAYYSSPSANVTSATNTTT